MSTPLSDAFRKAANEKMKEVEGKQKNRVEIAMERTEKRVEDKRQEIIEEYALNFYYDGYTPKSYKRTYQLPRAIWPLILEFRHGGQIGFNYGANFNANFMNHTKRGKSKRKIEPDEEIILDNFRAGKHPNTGVEQGSIWMPGMEGNAPDAIRAWKNTGAIQKIFMEEFRKLTK